MANILLDRKKVFNVSSERSILSRMFEKNYKTVRSIQHEICRALEAVEKTNTFKEDCWERPGGGSGYSRVLQDGNFFEKAGVNVSRVFGQLNETEVPLFQQLVNKTASPITISEKTSFKATGISLVIHPKNPFIPTTHANYRYFECQTENQTLWWYGGGADLTPYYLDEEDAKHFHNIHKDVCDEFSPDYYPEFKKQCDTYFYLPHRQETRGIGGIFFDYLQNPNAETLNTFISRCGNAFIDAYIPIVNKHKSSPYTEQERQWQEIRRGRYVEFNLIYDRGTLFGLKTNGRTESILMSLPPHVQWLYDYQPEPKSKEAALLEILKTPRDWTA